MMRELALLQRQVELEKNLPHLYGFPWYKWAREFFESTNNYNILCASNQSSKSSTQIRKCIHWATEKSLWPKLWKRRPLQFWYLYPIKDVSTIEFEKKWVPEFLPKIKDDPIYGWDAVYDAGKKIHSINFKSGVTVFFKSYATDVQNLQTGTVDAIFLDEEPPAELFDELNMRIAATQGYFHAVFTPTLGQEFWREVMEETGDKEKLVGAFKRCVSLYDCQFYEDGTPTFWTNEYIQKIKNSCRSENEIKRRVYGRFVTEEGRKFPSFYRDANVKKPYPIPKEWGVYAGVDIGSGNKNHAAAIIFVAVNPDFTRGAVFRGWRGDHQETSADDVFHKYKDMKTGLCVTAAKYDFSSKEFGIICTRASEPMQRANKSHDIGEKTINVLFKNQMLDVFDIPELEPLIHELLTVRFDHNRLKGGDDASDALRYCIIDIPWDWSVITGAEDMSKKPKEVKYERTREEPDLVLDPDVEEEMEFWNELYN